MPKKVIGIDAGASANKIVEISQSFRKATIMGASGWDNSSAPELNDDLIYTAEAPFPQQDVTSRIVRFPFSGARKLDQTAPFELESWIPFSSQEFITDYQVIERDKNSCVALVAGARKESVSNCLAKFEDMGVHPRSLIPEGFAYRSLARLMGAGEGAALAFLDLGETRSVLAVTVGDRAVASRSLPGALNRAEGEKGKISDRLIAEVGNTLRHLSAEEGIAPQTLYLCGDLARIEGIDALLAENPGIEVKVWSPPPEIEVELGPEHALALALALEHSHPIKGVNFRKGEFTLLTETAIIGEKMIMPGFIAVAFVLLLIVNSLFHNRILKSEAAYWDAEIATVAAGVLADEEVTTANALKMLNEELDRTKELEKAIGQTDYLSPLQAMTAISERIPDELDVDMEEIMLSERMLTIAGIITEYSQMDDITKALDGFEAFKRFDDPDLREKVAKSGGVRFSQRIFLMEEEETP